MLHIIRSLPCLDQLPDAAATKQFIMLMQFVSDKKLDPELRYVTFFLRYWRKWILEHPMYTLKQNCITENAYICIELNHQSGNSSS